MRCPLYMTQKKTVRKNWLHEILGARCARKEGLPPKATEFELCIALTTQKHEWLMLRALTTHCQHPRLDILLSDNRKLCNQSKSKRWNCVSQAMMFLQCCQQAMEESIYQVFCLAKLYTLNRNASVLVVLPLNSRSPALSKNYWNNSVNMN